MHSFFSSLTILSGVFCLSMPIAIAEPVPTPSPTSLSPNNLSDEPHAAIPQANASDPLAESEKPSGTPVESSSFNAEISYSAADLLPVEPTHPLTTAQAEMNPEEEAKPSSESNPEESTDRTEMNSEEEAKPSSESNPEASPDSPDNTELVAPEAAAASTKPSLEELAKLKQNPLSELRQVLVQTVVSPNSGGSGGTEGTYSLQVVWPFSLSEKWRLINYTILPLEQLPGTAGQDSTFGLGDTLLNFFIAPTKTHSAFVCGLGPTVLLPTRTDPALGSNRLGLGPAAILFYEAKQWSAGVVLQNVWSLGGSGVNEVNEFGAQYLLNYNLPHGWYLYGDSTITADWTAHSNNRWTVPVGGGFGKVFNIGKQSASASLQVFANVVRPDNSPAWGLNFQFALLFP